MRVVVIDATRKGAGLEYEVQMRVDGVPHTGHVSLIPEDNVWTYDSSFMAPLKEAPFAPRAVIDVIHDFHEGKNVSFPVDLGDFEQRRV